MGVISGSERPVAAGVKGGDVHATWREGRPWSGGGGQVKNSVCQTAIGCIRTAASAADRNKCGLIRRGCRAGWRGDPVGDPAISFLDAVKVVLIPNISKQYLARTHSHAFVDISALLGLRVCLTSQIFPRDGTES